MPFEPVMGLLAENLFLLSIRGWAAGHQNLDAKYGVV